MPFLFLLFALELADELAELFAEVNLFQALFNALFAHSLNLYAPAAVGALFVKAVGIYANVSNELGNLPVIEFVASASEPAKAVGVSVVQHIPEVRLRVTPEKVIYLVAPCCRKVQVGMEQGNIHTLLHKEFLYFKINHRHLSVILLEEL